MQKKIIFVLFIVASITRPFIGYCQSNTDYNHLKTIVESEVKKFKYVADLHKVAIGNINYVYTGSTHVIDNSTNDLIINLYDIYENTLNDNDEFKMLYIRFVIGHELGHKVQYYKWKTPDNGAESRIFLECEADIFSGFFSTEVLYWVDVPAMQKQNPAFDAGAYTERLRPFTMKVYKRIFEMGNKNQTVKTYPSTTQRLLAVRQGVLLSGCFITSYVEDNLTEEQKKANRAALDAMKENYKQIGKALNYDAGKNDNQFTWIHEEAVRIVHNNRSVTRNLVLYDIDRNWDTNASHPYVTYSFKVWNNNKMPVRFLGRTYTELVPRKNINDMINRAPVDSKPFDIILAPDQTTTISGELMWMANNDYEPRIVLPGEDESIYGAFDAVSPTTDNMKSPAFDADFSHWNNESLENIKDHLLAVYGLRDNLFSYTGGIGVSTLHTLEEVKKSRILYEPVFKRAGSEDQKIYYMEYSGSVGYVFNAATEVNKDIAQQHYDQITAMIKSSIPDLKAEVSESTSRPSVTYSDQGGDRVIRATLQQIFDIDNLDKKNYAVIITVLGKKVQ